MTPSLHSLRIYTNPHHSVSDSQISYPHFIGTSNIGLDSPVTLSSRFSAYSDCTSSSSSTSSSKNCRRGCPVCANAQRPADKNGKWSGLKRKLSFRKEHDLTDRQSVKHQHVERKQMEPMPMQHKASPDLPTIKIFLV